MSEHVLTSEHCLMNEHYLMSEHCLIQKQTEMKNKLTQKSARIKIIIIRKKEKFENRLFI